MRPSKKKDASLWKDGGFALIVTLWALVLLTVLAMNLSLSARGESASTRNFKEDARAYGLAQSAYEEALAYLMTDKDPAVDFVDGSGSFRTDAERPPISGPRETEDARVEISVMDEESRLNVNFLPPATLAGLFSYAGVPEREIAGVVDSLYDWIDPDDLTHLEGAEDRYYEPLGYKPKNRTLDVPEELLLIKGFAEEHLYGGRGGGGEARPLYDIITTWGVGININTASREVLELLGFGDLEADSIIEQRAKGGLRAAPARLGGLGVTAGKNFRIEVSARLSDSPQGVRITSVVRKTTGPAGAGFECVYWKEGVEGGGA